MCMDTYRLCELDLNALNRKLNVDSTSWLRREIFNSRIVCLKYEVLYVFNLDNVDDPSGV